MMTVTRPASARRPSQADVLVAVFDRADNFVDEYPFERVAKWVDQPGNTTVRDRYGRVRRIYWHEPVPEIEHGFPRRGNPLNQFCGQRYVYLQRVAIDSPYRVFSLVESRFMPPDMIQAVTSSVTVAVPSEEVECSPVSVTPLSLA